MIAIFELSIYSFTAFSKLQNYTLFIKIDQQNQVLQMKYTQRAFSIDSMLNRRRKSVEKRKNISTVIEKALKFQQLLKFRR